MINYRHKLVHDVENLNYNHFRLRIVLQNNTIFLNPVIGN